MKNKAVAAVAVILLVLAALGLGFALGHSSANKDGESRKTADSVAENGGSTAAAEGISDDIDGSRMAALNEDGGDSTVSDNETAAEEEQSEDGGDRTVPDNETAAEEEQSEDGGNRTVPVDETAAKDDQSDDGGDRTVPVDETTAEDDQSGEGGSTAAAEGISDGHDSNDEPAPDNETAVEEEQSEDGRDETIKGDESASNENADLTKIPEPTKTPVRSASGTPVGNHGKLKVSGSRLVDKNGESVILRGVSTHGLAWFPAYVSKASFKTLRDEWGASCVRLAMYTAEYGGYCSGGNKENLKNLVENGVKYATELGMYVIIDWHILSDSNPNTNKSEALKFFSEMSEKYASYDNVLYEICNEPNGGTRWSDIKKYAEEVIPVIRKNSSDSIIIVGTPTWSQEVDKAAADPVTGYDNIMYTIHFYAGTHKDDLRKRMTNAVNSGIPIFCSEFGTCDASGNGANDFKEADKWITAMENAGVSYCIWNLSNKSETSALISSGCSKTYGWKESELSESGKWYVKLLNKGAQLGKTEEVSESDSKNAGNKDNSGHDDSGISTNSKLRATISPTGSWNDGSSNYHQYAVKVENSGNGAASGWKVTVSFDSKVEIDQSWNGSFEVSGKKIIITPVDYNSKVDAGSYAEAGFIVKSAGNIGDPAVTVKETK